MVLDFAGYSHIGKRSNNEDSFRSEILGNTLLTVVADGLGGHANGEIASQIAVNTVLNNLGSAECIDEDALIISILDAGKAIEQSASSGLSTACALWMNSEYAVAVHVGDSRIYQFRNNRVNFQTLDHSHVQMSVLVGELDIQDVRHHKDRNRLFRVLGDRNQPPKADSRELSVMKGDAFLLCTDGFWESVTEETMLRTLRASTTAQEWLNAMKCAVFDADLSNQDNHTAVCIRL